jgi:hypothetical protein
VKRSCLLASLILLVALPAGAQTRGEKYSPDGGKFSVRFPGKPKEGTQIAKSAIGEISVFTASYATSDANAYMVSYNDFPEGAAKPEGSGTLFDGVRDGLKGKDGKLIDEAEVKVGDAPGRDIEIEKDKKRMKFRVVLRDGRLYQVAVIGTANFVKGKEAKAFLESFELAK